MDFADPARTTDVTDPPAEDHRVPNVFIAFIVMFAALALDVVALLAGLQVMWSARENPAHLVVVVSCVGLFWTGLLWLFDERIARQLAAFSLALIGIMYVPLAAALVPAYGLVMSWTTWLAELVYYVALGVVLLVPPRRRWSAPLFTALLVGAAIAGYTFALRWRVGEYARPSIAFYRLRERGGSLRVSPGAPDVLFPPGAREALESAGVGGELAGASIDGDLSNRSWVVVVTAAQPKVDLAIHYPRGTSVAYVYDGAHWQTLPHDAPVYAAHAKLVVEGDCNTLKRPLTGGPVTGGPSYCW